MCAEAGVAAGRHRTEQARPPTAAKPTVAAADPLRLQPSSAQACAAKTKGARDSPRPPQIVTASSAATITSPP
jgi:hypothetical protein